MICLSLGVPPAGISCQSGETWSDASARVSPSPCPEAKTQIGHGEGTKTQIPPFEDDFPGEALKISDLGI